MVRVVILFHCWFGSFFVESDMPLIVSLDSRRTLGSREETILSRMKRIQMNRPQRRIIAICKQRKWIYLYSQVKCIISVALRFVNEVEERDIKFPILIYDDPCQKWHQSHECGKDHRSPQDCSRTMRFSMEFTQICKYGGGAARHTD